MDLLVHSGMRAELPMQERIMAFPLLGCFHPYSHMGVIVPRTVPSLQRPYLRPTT